MPVSNVTDQAYFEAEATILKKIQRNPPSQEECHGTHLINEDEELERELECFVIKISADTEIDITSRLTKEEKDKILSLYV